MATGPMGQLTDHHCRQNCCRQWQCHLLLVLVLVLLELLLDFLPGFQHEQLGLVLRLVFRLSGLVLRRPLGQTWLRSWKK